jgi:hypothetical protein
VDAVRVAGRGGEPLQDHRIGVEDGLQQAAGPGQQRPGTRDGRGPGRSRVAWGGGAVDDILLVDENDRAIGPGKLTFDGDEAQRP